MKTTYLAQGIKKRRVVKKRVSRYRKESDRERKRLKGAHDWMYAYWRELWM